MNKYSIGNIFSLNPRMASGCEEAVLADFKARNSEHYSLLFLEYSSVDGYFFEIGTRTDKMLDNAYVECITPHFCYIYNLYDILKHYELSLLGMQKIQKNAMKILYFKSGKKYIQIFVSNYDEFYINLKRNGMFVYIYEDENFENLKLSKFGTFWSFQNQNPLQIFYRSFNNQENVGIIAKIEDSMSFVDLFYIQHVKNYKRNNGFGILSWNGFNLCDNLEEFKNRIL